MIDSPPLGSRNKAHTRGRPAAPGCGPLGLSLRSNFFLTPARAPLSTETGSRASTTRFERVMAAATPSDDELQSAVKAFLSTVDDLKTVTGKAVRRALEKQFGMKLKDRKDFINKSAVEAIEAVAAGPGADASSDSSEDEPIGGLAQDSKPEPSPRRRKPAPKKKKRRAVAKGPNANKPLKRKAEALFDSTATYYSRSGRPQRSGPARRQVVREYKESQQLKRQAEAKAAAPRKKRLGWSKPYVVTNAALREFLGADELPRQAAHKRIWDYGRDNNLINPNDKRYLLLDDTLRGIFKVKKVSLFKLNSLLSKVMKNPDL